MKSLIQKIFLNSNTNEMNQPIESYQQHLYNQLYAGKISLKEYFDALKK